MCDVGGVLEKYLGCDSPTDLSQRRGRYGDNLRPREEQRTQIASSEFGIAGCGAGALCGSIVYGESFMRKAFAVTTRTRYRIRPRRARFRKGETDDDDDDLYTHRTSHPKRKSGKSSTEGQRTRSMGGQKQPPSPFKSLPFSTGFSSTA
jgi:hypothetical protein